MVLIQIFLPLYDNDGERFPRRQFDRVRDELVYRFGGMTAYTQAPASGLWQEDGGETMHDDLLVHEVMTESLDEAWWRDYRSELERRFRQETLLVRAHDIRVL